MSSVFNSGAMGFILGFCLVVYLTTLIFASGSLNFQTQDYNYSCAYYGSCQALYIIIPAMALPFSVIAIILAIVQIFLFRKRRLTRNLFFCLNLLLTILWVPVIAIGWAPLNQYWNYSDEETALAATGWFIVVQQDFNNYQQEQSLYGSDYTTPSESAQINFSMGLLVMSCLTFGVVGLVTVCALIACIADQTNPTGNTAPGMVDSRQQRPGPVSHEAKSPLAATTGQHESYYGGQTTAVYPGT